MIYQTLFEFIGIQESLFESNSYKMITRNLHNNEIETLYYHKTLIPEIQTILHYNQTNKVILDCKVFRGKEKHIVSMTYKIREKKELR